MRHDDNDTGNQTDSLVVAIAGHTGYIGGIVLNQLDKIGTKYYKIPCFRNITAEEINLAAPKGKIVLINCSGSTPRQDQGANRDIYVNNVKSLEKLVSAFANRTYSILHMSTTHLNSQEILTEYANAKKDAEEYLNQMSSQYSFEAVNLRLPTIWSTEYIKEESLLHDITATSLEKVKKLIRSPQAIAQIASEETIGIQIKHFLENNGEKIGYDQSNSWTGSITQLIKLLKSENDSHLYSQSELKRIYNYWKPQRGNF